MGIAVSTSLDDGAGVYEIDPLRDPRWAELLNRHPRSSVFHTPSWLNALRLTYGYEPTVFCTAPPGGHLTGGLVACRVKSWLTGNRIVSLPFSDHCEPLVDDKEELDAILEALRGAVGKNCDYVELRPLVQTAGNSDFAESRSYYCHFLDLTPSSDVLLKSFHRDCVQRKIRRAERESLEYETGNSENLLRKFYRPLVMARRRHFLPPQPYSWFQHLSQAFGPGLQIRVASYQGRPVASILTLKHGKTVTYKYGGSDARWNRLGGMAFLLWQTILEAKNEGMTQLDLGRADMDNAGLIAFKERWSARRLPLRYLRFPASSQGKHDLSSSALLRTLVRCAPEWSLLMTGKFLYPHIG